VPILGADGEVVEWFGAASDVTIRREAEEALREGEARWRGLFERMAEGFEVNELVRDPDGRAADFRYLDVNPAWERHTGIPREAAVGRLVSEVVPGADPFWVETYARVVETGEPAHVERHVPQLGRWFEVRAHRTGPGRLAALVLDVTERRRAEGRRALLVAELNHRVKNTLAVVQSLALQTGRGAADPPAFAAAFQARLMALARAHDLLTRENWEGAPLGEVVRAALEAGGEGRVDNACGGCGGPDAAPLLAPAQALALAMALHELAANALKHGALSVPGGRVSVTCRADPGSGARVVEWLERGGPPVAGLPARRGFGLRLLQRGLAMQAGMAAELSFEPEGLRCALRLPPAG
jgi:PAS domain S-box-containing protein